MGINFLIFFWEQTLYIKAFCWLSYFTKAHSCIMILVRCVIIILVLTISLHTRSKFWNLSRVSSLNHWLLYDYETNNLPHRITSSLSGLPFGEITYETWCFNISNPNNAPRAMELETRRQQDTRSSPSCEDSETKVWVNRLNASNNAYRLQPSLNSWNMIFLISCF